MKIAIVTGGSSGIGRATALELQKRGCKVYILSRHPAHLSGMIHLCCDVADERQMQAAVREVWQREGRIDLLVNNAGFGISGAAEFTENEDAKRLLNVNLFGVVNGCKAVLPVMRQQGSGRIVNVSSFAALTPIPFQAWYSVSKAAVSAYTAALRNEVAPFGIVLCAVLPGDIHTGFTAAREKASAGDEIYHGRIARSVAVMEHDEQIGMTPEKAGRFLASVALRKRVKPEYVIGASYRALSVLARLLPCRLKSWVIGRMYAGGK